MNVKSLSHIVKNNSGTASSTLLPFEGKDILFDSNEQSVYVAQSIDKFYRLRVRRVNYGANEELLNLNIVSPAKEDDTTSYDYPSIVYPLTMAPKLVKSLEKELQSVDGKKVKKVSTLRKIGHDFITFLDMNINYSKASLELTTDKSILFNIYNKDVKRVFVEIYPDNTPAHEQAVLSLIPKKGKDKYFIGSIDNIKSKLKELL